jgi:hypothetical protein
MRGGKGARMIGFVKSLFKRKDWDEFCAWLNEYLEVEPSKLTITWQIIDSMQSVNYVRFDFAPGKPYSVTTAIDDDSSLCDRDHAYLMANRVLPILERAIKEQTPKTALWAHWG